MKLRSVHAENFRAIRSLTVPLDPALTVLHGNNAHGKTSLLAAIAVGLGAIPTLVASRGGIKFRASDVRTGADRTFVELVSSTNHTDGKDLTWRRSITNPGFYGRSKTSRTGAIKSLRDYIIPLIFKAETEPFLQIPVFAFYDTDRAVFSIPVRRQGSRRQYRRVDAYVDAIERKTNFKALVEWFHDSENLELRRQREVKNFELRLPTLDVVRRAITGVMPDVTNPHIEYPFQFVVQRIAASEASPEKLSLDQLSGGYRIVLALAADLAMRMAIANPNIDDPLQSEAIVLIDEIELHLHPEWQQRILSDLRRTFPNAQFIVSTHSPQVLTTVEPQHIIHLRATEDGIVAEQETGPTFGAKAGDVLQAVMGVKQRPDNEFRQKLEQYQTLIADNAGETPPALTLRRKLEALSPQDPALAALDVEIRHHRFMRELADRS